MSARMGNYALTIESDGGSAVGAPPAPSSASYAGPSMVIAADGTVAVDHTPGAGAGAAWAAMNAQYRDAEAKVREALKATAGVRNTGRRRRR